MVWYTSVSEVLVVTLQAWGGGVAGGGAPWGGGGGARGTPTATLHMLRTLRRVQGQTLHAKVQLLASGTVGSCGTSKLLTTSSGQSTPSSTNFSEQNIGNKKMCLPSTCYKIIFQTFWVVNFGFLKYHEYHAHLRRMKVKHSRYVSSLIMVQWKVDKAAGTGGKDLGGLVNSSWKTSFCFFFQNIFTMKLKFTLTNA